MCYLLHAVVDNLGPLAFEPMGAPISNPERLWAVRSVLVLEIVWEIRIWRVGPVGCSESRKIRYRKQKQQRSRDIY
jgi:hypothetical protein